MNLHFCISLFDIVLGDRKDIRPVKIPMPVLPKDSFLERVEQDSLCGNWLTEVVAQITV